MNKIDFIATVVVRNANPNGDPLEGNMPRTDCNMHGEISDVCIKRKIRNRLQDLNRVENTDLEDRLNSGNDIFVKANDYIDDNCKSLQERYETLGFNKKTPDDEVIETMTKKWIDVRGFGQVVIFDNKSIGIRGPISIGWCKSLSPITVCTKQIVRSTNGQKPKGEASRSSDTMGIKHFVDFGVYKIAGAINPYFAEKTGFSEEDVARVKEAVKTLFVNDSSSARPEGSMEVKEIFWFEHSSKNGNVSSAKIQNLFEYDEGGDKNSYEDYNIHLDEERLAEYEAKGLKLEVIEGL